MSLVSRESRSATAAAAAAAEAEMSREPLLGEEQERDDDDEYVEVSEGVVDASVIENIPSLSNFSNEKYSVQERPDGSFVLVGHDVSVLPTIVVERDDDVYGGFREVEEEESDYSEDDDMPQHASAAPSASAQSPPPSRPLSAAQTKAKRLAELLAVCPTPSIARRLLAMDYTKELMSLVTIDVLLADFEPPLCSNAGQRMMLTQACKAGSQAGSEPRPAEFDRPPLMPDVTSPPVVRRATCGHVNRRSSPPKSPRVGAADELGARMGAGEFGADSDADEPDGVDEAPPRPRQRAVSTAPDAALRQLAATVHQNRCLANLLRQVAPADMPLALRAVFALVKPEATFEPTLAPFLIEGMLLHMIKAVGCEGDLDCLVASADGVGPAIAQCQHLVAEATAAAKGGRQRSSAATNGGGVSSEMTALGELIVSSGAKSDKDDKSTLERGRIKALVARGAASATVRSAVSELHAAVRSPSVTQHELLGKQRSLELGAEGELISELLHSAHVYTVTGMLTSPDDRALVTLLRVVLEGLDRALGGVLKRLLPTGADTVKVATCIRTGKVRSIDASEVSSPMVKQGWLSTDAAATGKAKAAAKVPPSLQRIWSAIEYGLVTSHSRDTTLHFSLSEVYMNAVLAASVTGVAELVLGNVMGEYEDAWAACHRGSAPCPTMRAVLELPEIREQMLCVAQARLQSEQGVVSSAADDQTAQLRAEMNELASKLHASQAAISRLAAATPAAGLPPTPTPTTRQKKAAAATAAKTATAAARAAAAPTAAAAAAKTAAAAAAASSK